MILGNVDGFNHEPCCGAPESKLALPWLSRWVVYWRKSELIGVHGLHCRVAHPPLKPISVRGARPSGKQSHVGVSL